MVHLKIISLYRTEYKVFTYQQQKVKKQQSYYRLTFLIELSLVYMQFK